MEKKHTHTQPSDDHWGLDMLILWIGMTIVNIVIMIKKRRIIKVNDVGETCAQQWIVQISSYTYIDIYTHMINIHNYIYIYKTCIDMYIHACVYNNTNTYTFPYTYTYAHKYIYTHTRTHIYIHIYIYTHWYIHVRRHIQFIGIHIQFTFTYIYMTIYTYILDTHTHTWTPSMNLLHYVRKHKHSSRIDFQSQALFQTFGFRLSGMTSLQFTCENTWLPWSMAQKKNIWVPKIPEKKKKESWICTKSEQKPWGS